MRSAAHDGCGCFPTGRHYPGIAHLLSTVVRWVAEEFAADTPLRRRPGSQCTLKQRDGALELLLGDRRLSLPGAAHVAVRFVLDADRLRPSDLPGIDQAGALVLPGERPGPAIPVADPAVLGAKPEVVAIRQQRYDDDPLQLRQQELVRPAPAVPFTPAAPLRGVQPAVVGSQSVGFTPRELPEGIALPVAAVPAVHYAVAVANI